MVNSKDFGERIQKLMDHYELSASAFADAIDTGRSSISHILSGRNKPSLDFVLKITDTYPEVDMYWLLNGKGSFPKNKESKPDSSTLIKNSNDTPEENTPLSHSGDLFSQISDKNASALTENEPNVSKNSDGDPVKKEYTQKQIRQIIVFYTDGTFELFKN